MQEHARSVVQHSSIFYTQDMCVPCSATGLIILLKSRTICRNWHVTVSHRPQQSLLHIPIGTQCSRVQVWDPSFNPDCTGSWHFSVIKEKLFCLKNREMLDQSTFNINYKAPVEQESSWASGEDRWAAGIAWR